MKKNIFAYILMMLPAVLMTSCLKDQEDKFSESASQRSANYLAYVKEVLMSSENGWVLNYFPDRNQSYGGYAYTVKFDSQNVTVGSELAGDGAETITSTYALDNEDGPVLTFDTYNAFMHYFATPTGSSGAGGYEAYDGDFIFIIMGVSEDKNTITLKGSRTGNTMYMYRNDRNTKDYINDCLSVIDDVRFEVFKKDEITMNVDLEERYASFSCNGETKECSLAVTDKGIKLYEPISINGMELFSFTYDKEAETFTSDENASIVLKGTLPDGWKSYEELLGKYDVNGSTVEVVANSDGKSYTIKNFSYTGLSIQAYYKYAIGSFVIPVQYIGLLMGKYYSWLIAYNGETITWDTNVKFRGTNSATDPLVITFSNKSYTTFWEGAFETEEPSMEAYAGYLTQYPEPFVMKKK